MLGVEVVPGAFPGEPLPALVVEHDDGDVGRAMPIERGPLCADDAVDVVLQPGVERRLDARRTLRAGVRQHHLDEVRRKEGPVHASEHQPFTARLVDLAAVRTPAAFICPRT